MLHVLKAKKKKKLNLIEMKVVKFIFSENNKFHLQPI